MLGQYAYAIICLCNMQCAYAICLCNMLMLSTITLPVSSSSIKDWLKLTYAWKDCICEPRAPNYCTELNMVSILSHCKRGFSYKVIVQSFCGQASRQRNPRKGRLQKQVTWNT